MIVGYMGFKLSFLSVLLSICICVSSILCCLESPGPRYAHKAVESSVFNIEKPGLAVFGVSGQSFSPVVFFPELVAHTAPFFKFWLFKKLGAIKNVRLQSFPAKKILFVVLSINAP